MKRYWGSTYPKGSFLDRKKKIPTPTTTPFYKNLLREALMAEIRY